MVISKPSYFPTAISSKYCSTSISSNFKRGRNSFRKKALIPFDIDPSPEQLREYFRSNKPTPRQKDLVKKMVDDVNMKSIIDHLYAPQFKTTLAWFHGQCDKNTGRWIRSTTTRNKALA